MHIKNHIVYLLIIVILLPISLTAESKMLNVNSKINITKELNFCTYILEYNSNNNLRKRLELKDLSKTDKLNKLMPCAKALSEIKLKNRMKACREKILINENYRFNENNKQEKKAFEKKFTQCVYNKW